MIAVEDTGSFFQNPLKPMVAYWAALNVPKVDDGWLLHLLSKLLELPKIKYSMFNLIIDMISTFKFDRIKKL